MLNLTNKYKRMISVPMLVLFIFINVNVANAWTFKGVIKKAASSIATAVTTTVAAVNNAVVQPVIQNVVAPVINTVVAVVEVVVQIVTIGLGIGSDQKRIIVKWKDGTNTSQIQDSLTSFFKNESMRKLFGINDNNNIDVFVLNTSGSIFDVYNRIRLIFDKNVEYIEDDKPIPLPFPVNDPDLYRQWYIPKINANAAWKTSIGTGMIVAVADTGVDCNHSDLIGKCLPGRDVVKDTSDGSDIQKHGTWVAGVIAATLNNGTGIVGIANGSKILPIRISDDAVNGSAYISDMAKAINWAASQNADIINISYTGFDSYTLELASEEAFKKGMIVVMAAGNANKFLNTNNSPYITLVSASDYNDDKSSFSNYGYAVDIIAPGSNIYTTNNGGGYSSVNGTSFAAPIAAAVIALIKSTNSNLSPAQILNILHNSSKDLGIVGWDNVNGWGRVDAEKALIYAKNPGVHNTVRNTFNDSGVYNTNNAWSSGNTSRSQSSNYVADVLSTPTTIPPTVMIEFLKAEEPAQ